MIYYEALILMNFNRINNVNISYVVFILIHAKIYQHKSSIIMRKKERFNVCIVSACFQWQLSPEQN